MGDEPGEMQKKVAEIEVETGKRGLFFGQDSLQILANDKFKELQENHVFVLPQAGHRFKDETEMDVLGTRLDATGSHETACRHRLEEANKVWHRFKRTLCSPNLTKQFKLYHCNKIVGASALHNAGGWTPTAKVCRMLDIKENTWHRQVLRRKRKADEDWVTHQRRATHEARKYRKKWNVERLAEQAWKLHHKWMGHIWRQISEPEQHDSIAAVALEWRNARWWRTTQALGTAAERRPQGMARPGRGRPRKDAEETLEELAGTDWRQRAQDREDWKADEEAFVQACRRKFRQSGT